MRAYVREERLLSQNQINSLRSKSNYLRAKSNYL